jgi:hypothetical protein
MPAPTDYDLSAIKAATYIRDLLSQVRSGEAQKAKKAAKRGTEVKEESKEAVLIVADHFPTWQEETIKALQEAYDPVAKTFTGEKELLAKKGLMKDKRVMAFAMGFKVQFDWSCLTVQAKC